MLRKLSLRISLSICLGPFLWLSFLCWSSSCSPTPESPRSVRRLSQEGSAETHTNARRQSAIYNLRASSFAGHLLPRPWDEPEGVTVKSDAQEENALPTKEELSFDRSVDQGWSGWLMAALGVVGVLFPLTYCIIPHLRKLLCKSGCLDPSYHVVPDSETIGHASIHAEVPLEATSLPQPSSVPAAPTEYFFIGEEEVASHLPATESEPEAELYPEAEGSGPGPRRAPSPFSPPSASERARSPRPELGVSFQAASEPILPVPCVVAKPQEPQEAAKPNLLMLYASPLCKIDATRGATPLPGLAVEQEWRGLVTASVESPNGPLTLAARPMTAASLQRSLSHGITTRNNATTILHLSAHGTPQGLVLEDGKGTAHLLSCELVKEMLSLRAGASPFQLVVVNACQSQAVGTVFADAGIPHVVCTEDKIMDTWVQLFMRTFYTALFCGGTVAAAFDEAVTSLRCQPGIPQEAGQSFCLLPRAGDHDKVICSARVAARSKPQTRMLSTPFDQLLPELPEDFTGRTLDVWSILQHLDKRRFVTVCNQNAVPGIGKSAVLDAVHCASALHMQMRCVKIRVASDVEDCASLMSSIRTAVQLALAEEDWLSSSSRKGTSCQSRLTSGALTRPRKCLPRRQTRKAQQEPEVPAWSNEELLQGLLHELGLLASKWQRRITAGAQTGSASRGSKLQAVPATDASGLGILLLIHGCGGLLERCPDETLKILSEILRHCPVRILLSSQYRLLGPGCSQFKVVHYELEGLKPPDAARLLLRRAQRPLKWKEVLTGTDAERTLPSVTDDAHVVLSKDSEKEVLELIASHPAVARLKGAPQALIELACQMGHRSLTDYLGEGGTVAV